MSFTAETRHRHPVFLGTPLDTYGFGLFLLCCLGALPVFWSGLVHLGEAWSRPEYSHGPVIPVLSFYMYLRELKAVPPPTGPVTDRWPGLALIALGLLAAIAGNLVGIPDIVTYGLIVWIGGLVLVGFGWSRGILFWPAVLHLVFMLPLPNMIYWNVTIALQFLSSEIGVWLLRVLQVPVYLEGNVIDLGTYKLQVAEACSGLRYMFPIMSFTYVFAVLYRGPVWHKLVLLFSAVPIAVLMNSFRIGVIGFLVDRKGIEQAEGFLHVFEGWVIFLTCIAILFAMAVLMQRLSGDKRHLGDALDMDFSNLGEQFRRVFTIPASGALIAMTLLTCAISAAWVLAPARASVTPERDSFVLFPMNTGEWRGERTLLDPEVEAFLGADDFLSSNFVSPAAAAPVDFFVAYYHKETDGSYIHSPAACLPAGGWEVFRIDPTRVDLPGTDFGGLTLNRAIIQKGLSKQLVYFWFEGRGRSTANDMVTKFHTVSDSLLRGRRDISVVRLITPIGEEETEAQADERLKNFLTAHIDYLPRFVPE
ncbi:VPLPA-CTERM-specific exosortase XrtD [Amaricoccus tamworthensis]|uniref:VPLPA-CTERM-specific exosortase XrtD n=1 Tax=Amaricoccus tamworthensis TaxID=57002 RepID=UPI003C79DC96